MTALPDEVHEVSRRHAAAWFKAERTPMGPAERRKSRDELQASFLAELDLVRQRRGLWETC